MLPHARRDGLRVERIGEDTLIHDSAQNRTHRLDPVAALLWRHCNGRTSIAELIRRLRSELGVAADDARVWQELEQLEAAGLLREPLHRAEDEPAISRREMVGMLGRTGVLLLAAPTYFASRSHAEPVLRVGTSHPESDRELRDVFLEGGFVVPEGKVWKVGPNVRTNGSAVVHGQLVMRPGAGLKFQGVDLARFVGGGHGLGAAVQQDTGLWVGGNGLLDIQGTPKVGWNRTGTDPTWRADDEYYIAPTESGDYTPRRWRPGQPIPRVHPRVPPAEVMNVTRDIVIEGPGHIHISSHRPQRIEYVLLRHLGASNRGSEGPVEGRYALHLHHGHARMHGTRIRGVAAVGSGGRVLVVHESHGVTVEDFVSVNSLAEGFWWDVGDRTNDITVDRLCVSGVHMPRAVTGKTSRPKGIELGFGDRMTIKNSAVSGVEGGKLAVGFNWTARGVRQSSLWEFSEGNVAHNNRGPGLRFWTNSRHPHLVENYISYRNGEGGIENGAYNNAVRYGNSLLVDDHIFHRSSSKTARDGRGSRYQGVEVYSRSGPAVEIGAMNQPGDTRLEFIDCVLQPGRGAPKVRISDTANNPFRALFRRCGVTPDDIVFHTPFARPLQGTSVIIEEESGKRWEVTLDMQRQRKIVHELPSLAHRTS